MRRIMRLLHFGVALALATGCFADTITMKNGRTLSGTYLGGSARQVRMDTGDRVETLDVTDIDRIEFNNAAAPAPHAQAAPRDESRPVLRRAESPIMRPDPVAEA